MQKIPTMFRRDESVRGHPVTDAVTPGCEWVLNGEGFATEKMDGTNVKVENGQLWKRRKPAERDYDVASYVPCDRADPADRWAYEAFDRAVWPDGIYELIGPKIQGNPHGREQHIIVPVLPPSPDLEIPGGHLARSFEGLRDFLASRNIEGIVFHHPDGQLAKIKRRDFGLPWPEGPEAR